ncbi:MAG TPA: hypothetical protein VMX97_08565 [Hyphomicrobiaceae bacterium]|nr:hypothetical protein [Hyphomicrobiaceae bacterium]
MMALLRKGHSNSIRQAASQPASQGHVVNPENEVEEAYVFQERQLGRTETTGISGGWTKEETINVQLV